MTTDVLHPARLRMDGTQTSRDLLLRGSGGDHGYRAFPTLGPLFLRQSIAGLSIGIGVVAARRLWAAALGIGVSS